MNYHNITKDDMLNGDGLRVVLWVAGCSHGCKGCHNPITWNPDGGLPFDEAAMNEIFAELEKDYIHGITFSGGDPLHYNNRYDVVWLIFLIKNMFPEKTVWIYTGYTWEGIVEDFELKKVVGLADVLVEGKFVEELKDENYPWAGSTNQRVIDVRETLRTGEIVLHEN